MGGERNIHLLPVARRKEERVSPTQHIHTRAQQPSHRRWKINTSSRKQAAVAAGGLDEGPAGTAMQQTPPRLTEAAMPLTVRRWPCSYLSQWLCR